MKKSYLIISAFCLVSSITTESAFGMKRFLDGMTGSSSSSTTIPQPQNTTTSIESSEEEFTAPPSNRRKEESRSELQQALPPVMVPNSQTKTLVNASAYAFASSIINNGIDNSSIQNIEIYPNGYKDILYKELLRQAKQHWSNANWYDIQTFYNTNGGHTDYVSSVTLSGDGNTIASGSYDHTVKIYTRNHDGSWALSHTFNNTNGGHTNVISSVTLSHDGNTLASGSSDLTVKIYTRNADGHWALSHTFNNRNGGHSHYVSSVTLSGDGNTLASGSYDHTVKIYNARNFESLENLLKFIQTLQ